MPLLLLLLLLLMMMMMMTLLSQAPLQLLLGASWANACGASVAGVETGCSAPRLLGVCKLLSWQLQLQPSPRDVVAVTQLAYSYAYAYGPFAGYSSASALVSSSTLADLLLWVLLRLQAAVAASPAHAAALRCAAARRSAAATAATARRCASRYTQARSALRPCPVNTSDASQE